MAHPNRASIAYAYLATNWLGTMTHNRTGGVTFDTITYAYDANGNHTTLTDYTGTTTLGYDALNRLTSLAYPGTYGTWSWTHDALGNRITQNSPSGQMNYGYDANNRLTQAGTATYSYDANGNLTSISNGTTFTYDSHNRLSQANLPGGLVVQYLYNGDGLKIRRTEGSAVTRYYHNGIRQSTRRGATGASTWSCPAFVDTLMLGAGSPGEERTMPRTRPPYPSEFRAEAVRLVRESGKPAAQIAMDLAISYESLRHISMREESAGFTLLELIIGLALLAVLAVGFFGLYTSGVLAGQHAQRLAVATFRAQSRLEYLTVSPAAPGEEVAVGAVFSVPADSQEKTDIVLIAPGLGQATTLVTWTWRGQERQTTLITLFRHP